MSKFYFILMSLVCVIILLVLKPIWFVISVIGFGIGYYSKKINER
jgi:hypothetical protein